MPLLRRAFVALLACATLVVVARAEAQTVTLSANGISHKITRTNNMTNEQINYADCINDDVISFQLTLANFVNYNIDTWVGSTSSDPCTDEAHRSSSGATRTCGPLDTSPASTAVDAQGNFHLAVHVRDIIQGVITPTVDFPTADNPTTADICANMDTAAGPQSFIIYFMLLQAAGTGAPAGSATWPITGGKVAAFDLVGPPPPTNISVGGGDDRLLVSYDAPAGVTDLKDYRLYCNPPPGALPADAGTVGGDASADAGGTCDSTPLVPGDRPDEAYFCGTSGQAKGLVNGQTYALAVASTDKYLNSGVLSDAVCGTPVPVTGFFEAYRAAGGKAGGGFCSLGATPTPGVAVWLVGATGLLAWRRRRTR